MVFFFKLRFDSISNFFDIKLKDSIQYSMNEIIENGTLGPVVDAAR